MFATVAAFLTALDLSERPPAQLVLCFTARLLAILGLSPRLDRCGLCGKAAPPERLSMFDAQLGHLVCSACGGAPHRIAGAARVLMMRAAGPDWIAAAEGEPLAAGAARGRDSALRRVRRAAHRPAAEGRRRCARFTWRKHEHRGRSFRADRWSARRAASA